MSINGVRRLGGGVLPAVGTALGGAAAKAPSVGHGGAQHAVLSARPPGGGNGGGALRVGVAKLPQLNLGHALDGIRAKTAEGPQQVPKSAILQGTYPPDVLSRAMGVAADGLARLRLAGLA